ncbi:hypothetical protein [Citrifermentans bremense]|uniref:hypothetical protein n=1 Tax=Citrifermentans bremense TaxID=60035 RepID=UPI000479B4D8|nr:hypothetical protein [Citrifermentans bremense]
MRKRMKLLLAFAVVPILLSGCIVAPWYPYYDDDGGYYHHDRGRWHDRGYDGRWYDGRGYGRR